MTNIIGRVEEFKELNQILTSNKAELLALYGRRRIGKTYLIRQFFTETDVIFFNVTGTKEGSRKQQLARLLS